MRRLRFSMSARGDCNADQNDLTVAPAASSSTLCAVRKATSKTSRRTSVLTVRMLSATANRNSHGSPDMLYIDDFGLSPLA